MWYWLWYWLWLWLWVVLVLVLVGRGGFRRSESADMTVASESGDAYE